MRSRNLKPGFFKNEILCSMDPLCRILFEGLWCLADKEGRLEDRPTRIRVEILPYDNCDIDSMLEILASHGFILRYEVNGNKYVQILNFSKHQNPHNTERDSDLPSPLINGSITVKKRKSNGYKLNRYRESGISKEFKEGGVGETKEFNHFWELYPTRNGKKIGRRECFEFFLKNFPQAEIPSLFIATQYYAQSKTVKDGYAKDPIRFLKKDFWKDWIEPPEQEVPSYLRGCKEFLDHAEQESTEEDRKDQ
jgi:hypothetical protein